MSLEDRNKWEARYRCGAYRDRRNPSQLVTEHAPDVLATQRATSGDREFEALDIACGAGRNALYLASLGYRVDAVDISAEALERGARAAREAGYRISWIQRDLDQGLPRGLGDYDLILIMRYLDLSLVAAAAERLRPGGYLICEAHLTSDRPVIGPRDRNFRVAPGELRAAAVGLQVVEYWEGHTHDPDGRAVALARLVAWRPYPAP
ncbi:MAG TPA: class I SAM-dependent methyltransferase [Pseudomonadales bacterium]